MIPVFHIFQALLHAVSNELDRRTPKTPEQIKRERIVRRRVEVWLSLIVFYVVLAVVVGYIIVVKSH